VFAAQAQAQNLDFLVSPGPLARAHSDLAGIKNCVSCHAPGKGVEPERCLACHQDLAQRVRAGRGFHRTKAKECIACHPDHQGEAFSMVRWNLSEFDHRETGYPILGLHLRVAQCSECHRPPLAPARLKSATFLLNDARCLACHADPHRGRLGADCERCHTVDTPFRNLQFDHERTAFPLRGAHRRVVCERCHPNQRWKDFPFSRCLDCHADPHRPTLGADCERCHGLDSWKKATFDHERTRFPLRGQHRTVECRQCHPGGELKKVPFARCADCHRQDPHQGQFRVDCADCHRVEGFRPTTFDHARSNYPLSGKHQSTLCEKCHRLEEAVFPAGKARAVRYRPLASACAACHDDVHRGQLQQACDLCHTTSGFERSRLIFQHDRHSRFPLLGKHATVACDECHRREKASFPSGTAEAIRYRPLSVECASCHDNPHQPAAVKASLPARTGLDCQRCHTVDSFRQAAFDHQKTSFPLKGAHFGVACERCHGFRAGKDRRVVQFQNSPRACLDCHRSPHASRRYDRCEECHNLSNWRVRAF
jgi:hypothetical protein